MAKTMKTLAALSIIATAIFTTLYIKTSNDISLTCAITFGTISYHLCMRLLIGLVLNAIFKNQIDYSKKWFQVSKTELKFYEVIKAKQWKNKMPTWDVNTFDKGKHFWDDIAQATCQSELVHETIVLFSFVPIVASIWFGALPVFVITSVLSAAYDSMFVIMQRYNRPRILKLVFKG